MRELTAETLLEGTLIDGRLTEESTRVVAMLLDDRLTEELEGAAGSPMVGKLIEGRIIERDETVLAMLMDGRLIGVSDPAVGDLVEDRPRLIGGRLVRGGDSVPVVAEGKERETP